MNAESAGLLIRVTQVYGWVVFLGAWAQMGWVDWREQKIRNQFLIFWLKFVLAGYLLVVGQSVLGELGFVRVFVLRDYYYALLLHAALSVTSAYALWWLRVWPAGDVKLFVLLALCYPLMRVPGSFANGLLFLEVLINVFVPAAAFLFLTAGKYLWQTRFAHYKTHVTLFVRNYYKDFRFPEVDLSRFKISAPQTGPLSAGFDPRAAAGSAAAGLRSRAFALWTPVKEELRAVFLGYKAKPFQFLIDAASWLSMVAIMSMISYYLNDVITSNVLKTLVCFALMFTWSRICQFVGTGWALGVVFSVCAILLWRHPDLNLPALATIFGHITVFSLCIFLGIQLAFKIIAGRTGYVFLPFLMMLPGLVPWRYLFGLLWSGLGAVLAALSAGLGALRPPSLSAPPLPPLPGLPPLPALQLPAWLGSSDLWLWATMGLFFGLALVFVKIWDAESYKTVPVDHIDKFMTLGPELVARIEDDEDFRDEHFTTLYADGLTAEQAEALREWCRGEGLETVPLAPTISFANWIFLGYFLTRLLQGHVLRFLY